MKRDEDTRSPSFSAILTLGAISLTPSLPQPVKFPGWKMRGRACKPYIFRSYNTSTFSAMRLDKNPFTRRCEKRMQKGVRVWDFALLWLVFKWRHGSEGVNLRRPEDGHFQNKFSLRLCLYIGTTYHWQQYLGIYSTPSLCQAKIFAN